MVHALLPGERHSKGSCKSRCVHAVHFPLQCPLVPEFALRFNDIEAFDGVLSDLVNKPDDLAEVTEAYKFVFRDRSKK